MESIRQIDREPIMARQPLLWTALSLYALLVHATICFAQCASDEVLIGEDEDNYYCVTKSAAQCVAEKGQNLKKKIGGCKAQGMQCARDQGIPETEALCFAGLYFNTAAAIKNPVNPALPYTLGAALVSCGIEQAIAMRAWAPCLKSMDQCRTEALAVHKSGVQMCLRR
jgi:hypothetical protein